MENKLNNSGSSGTPFQNTERKQINPLIITYLERELNLSNFNILFCYNKIIHDVVVYEVVIEDITTKEQSHHFIDNLGLLSFIYNSSQKTFFE